MEFINKIKDFFGRLFCSNNEPEVQPIFDASTIRRIEDDDRYINPNRINSSFDLMNFDRIRELEKELDETKRECKQKLEETNRRVDQINQRVDNIEININRNTEDINRLTNIIETLAVSTQNHEAKMEKYEKMIENDKIRIEKLEQSLADNKIRINKQDRWMKKYAKDVFKNKNRKPERDNDSRINSSFVSCTNENSRRLRPDMEHSHDSEIYNYDNEM